MQENGETDTFLFLLLCFICNLICLTERKSIYDDNPQGSNESSGVPLPWESFLPENATNLGKMNHSHFIWTSVLTPPSSPPPDFHSFVTVLLQLVQVAGGSGAKRNATWRWSKMLSCGVYNMVFPSCTTTVTILGTLSANKPSTLEKAYGTK